MVPVKKKSKCAKRKRRSHLALTLPHIVACAKCGSYKLPHTACGVCGFVNPSLRLPIRAEES
jgi:large subunit ribosomal protein L32